MSGRTLSESNMVAYWGELMKYDTPMQGQQNIAEVREQIQEDVISFVESFGFISHPEFIKDNVCQIVVDNFKKLEK